MSHVVWATRADGGEIRIDLELCDWHPIPLRPNEPGAVGLYYDRARALWILLEQRRVFNVKLIRGTTQPKEWRLSERYRILSEQEAIAVCEAARRPLPLELVPKSDEAADSSPERIPDHVCSVNEHRLARNKSEDRRRGLPGPEGAGEDVSRAHATAHESAMKRSRKPKPARPTPLAKLADVYRRDYPRQKTVWKFLKLLADADSKNVTFDEIMNKCHEALVQDNAVEKTIIKARAVITKARLHITLTVSERSALIS
jgi:hypothetical protein